MSLLLLRLVSPPKHRIIHRSTPPLAGVIALVLAAGGMAERVIIATCFGGNCGSIGNAVMEWVAFGVVALGTVRKCRV